METLPITKLAEAGAIGIAVLLITLLYFVIKSYNKVIANHIDHFTRALESNTKIIGEITKVMENTCRIMERVQNNLDKLK